MRLIDADAVVKYLRDFRCSDCDRRKGMKNGKVCFCYEIGDTPCRACDIGDTIEYFLDDDIAPTIDAIPVEWLEKQADYARSEWDYDTCEGIRIVLKAWEKEQETR